MRTRNSAVHDACTAEEEALCTSADAPRQSPWPQDNPNSSNWSGHNISVGRGSGVSVGSGSDVRVGRGRPIVTVGKGTGVAGGSVGGTTGELVGTGVLGTMVGRIGIPIVTVGNGGRVGS